INGGYITFTNYGDTTGSSPKGNQIVDSSASVLANGTTGNGGNILFQGNVPSTLIVTVNGLVQATNTADTSGLIGFNGGPSEDVTLNGNGTIHAGQYVEIGNLSSSPVLAAQMSTVLPTQSAGTITIASTLTAGNEIITNGTIPVP